MKKRVLRAIFFDVDDTLYSSSEFAAMARLNAIKAMIKNGLKMEIKECLTAFNKILHKHHSNYNFHFNDLLKAVGRERYPAANEHVLVAAGVVAYHNTKNSWLKPYPDSLEVVKILSQTTPLCLGVISSGYSIKQAEKLFRFGIFKYLDPEAIFFSQELGVDKPNKDFFRIPCKKTGVRPEEAMYVGDRPGIDVQPVKQLGMVSVLNRRSGKYMDTKSAGRPDYIVHDFWELLELVNTRFDVQPRIPGPRN
ncbi:MAG: HAD-IA family hydrolase [Fibrobacterota bacterium]